MADAASDFTQGVVHARSLTAEVKRLRDNEAAANGYAEQIDRLNAELDDMKRLQGFKAEFGKTAIPAEITGAFATDNRITLDVGSDSGVEPEMPVVTARGLLAVIQTVEPGRSQALLLTSPVTRIWAMALRKPPPAGSLSGEGSSTLVVDFLTPDAAAQNGDEMVTTGFSSHIPRGIPIGRVIKIEDSPDFGSTRAIVYPWASLGTAREVYVLK